MFKTKGKDEFLDAEERPFRDFYVCGNVKRKLISPIIFRDKHGSEIPSGNRVEKEIPDIRIDDLTHHFCIFSGNGGAGEALDAFSGHLLLDSTIQSDIWQFFW